MLDTLASSLRIIHSFRGRDGAGPCSQLIEADNGYLYGVAGGGTKKVGTIFRIRAEERLKNLYFFERGYAGYAPRSGLLQASNGYFFGTTECGGPNFVPVEGGPVGDGTIFQMGLDNQITTLHSFSGTDGSYPSTLIEASDGCLYGTTRIGGVYNSASCQFGCGTVFRITLNGKLTTLHCFNGQDGATPQSGLAQASDGNLYGTSGGGRYGFGTIYRITLNGHLTTLYDFKNTSDGHSPIAGLLAADDGYLYGTTFHSGRDASGPGYGTIFRIGLDGTFTSLHCFSGHDGAGPYGLIQAKNGHLYGITQSGGAEVDAKGTAFQVTTNGVLTTLHSFRGENGICPRGSLVEASDGCLYGTTNMGGVKDKGTVFQITLTVS